MADAEYTIGLSVSGEGDVESAASAVEGLDDGLGDVEKSAKDAGDSLGDAAKDAAKLADETEDAAGSAAKAVVNYGEIEGALGKLGGPIGRLGQKGFGLADSFQKLGNTFTPIQVGAIAAAAGVAALAAASVAALAGIVALTGGLVFAALRASDKAKKFAAIGDKLKKDIADIFSGPSTVDATSKFADALSGLTDRFGENHAEGRALQKLLSIIVDPLINGLTKLMPLAIQVFRGMIILALDVAIAVLKAKKAVEELIPDWVKDKFNDLAGEVDVLGVALEVGKWVMGLFVASIAVVVVIIGIVVAVIGGLIAIFGLLVVGVAKAVVAIGSMVADAIGALIDFGSSGSEAAAQMVDGLVAGIRSGAGAVVEAVKAMAAGAVNAIKSALKIASPSKIFESMGEFTGEGFALGVETETANVETALETMVTPPAIEAPAATPPRGSAGGSAGGSASVDLSGASFVFNGVKDAENAVSMLEEALTTILEGDAIQVGAG